MKHARICIWMTLLEISLYVSCSADSSRLERMTHIRLPESTETIQLFDNSEFFTIGKFVIKKDEDIPQFIARNKLLKASRHNDSILQFDHALNKENRAAFVGGQFHHASGRTETHRWNVLVKASTGELWIEVLYPDQSGDNP